MFDYFFITVWIEYNNKLYAKVLPDLQKGCQTHVERIYKEIKPPYKIKEIKCDKPKEFYAKRKDKEYGHAYKTIR